MGPFAITAIAFATLASAVPHAGHRHAHKHSARSHAAAVENIAPIAGRSLSTDGSCGSWSGMTCGEGYCCGANGWCGNSSEHCGAGCQSDFGQCGSSSAPISVENYAPAPVSSGEASSAASPSTGSGVSPNGLCGTQYGYTCQGSNFGDSCSEWGYCGSNSTYSGGKCQSAYGTCDEPVAAATGYAPAPSSSASEASSSSATSVADKGHAPTYAGPSTTMITKAQPTSTQAATSAPAYSAPPAYSSPSPSTSSPAAYSTESTSQAPAPTPYSSTAPSSSAAAPSSYGGAAPSAGPYIKTYQGNGSPSSGWPSQESWLSTDAMWAMNTDILKSGCDYFQVPADSSDEIANLKSAVSSISSSAGVDERFVLAIMLQESNGCVRAPTTSYSVQNPGLFQSHAGTGSCNNGAGVQNPCPESELHQMVSDGVMGTASGDGLKQLTEQCAGKGAQTYYEAARMYNSGSVDPSGDLGMGVATHCYVSDVANRLMGWSQGPSACDSATVGQ